MTELGRRGGSVSVPKGFAKMSPKRRKEIAAAGVAARREKRESD